MSLVEIIVTVAILAILGGVLYQNEAATSRIGGDVARIDQTARVLGELADAIGRTTGTGGATSFNQVIGQLNSTATANAGKLSHVTKAITVADRNSCMYNYVASEAGRWSTPFYHRLLPPEGFQIAAGFFAQDSLIRFNGNGDKTTTINRPDANDALAVGTLAIVIPNVSASDAIALANRVEGDQLGSTGAVRYTPNATDTVTMFYHFTIRGC